MSEWLRGAPGAPALAFGGDVVRVGELAAAVAAASLPPGDGLIGCPAGMPPVLLITTVLAALERGRPVLVGGGSEEAAALDGRLPAGTALALRTSGSSGGGPAVVARTEESWLASAVPLAEITGIEASDRIAVTGPLHVSMHLYAALHALWAGASVGDGLRGASVVHATPTRLARLLGNELDAARAPDVRMAVVAGAAMSAPLREAAGARLHLVEYYGAAELSFVAVGRGDGLEPFAGAELELREAAAGRELWVRSPYLALGAIGGGMLRRDTAGFATVGDLAETAADGRLRVLGRGDAAITTAGATVLAEHVEAELSALPGVAATAVVGEPHELLGERVVAVVELSPAPASRRDAAKRAVVDAARARLEPAELPRRWFFGAVPRTDSGKVARGAVRAALAAGTLEGESA
ncbi:AMP-binding enzyme [Agromyces italicus]|uniref:AMP-binding enzyme n=1 Tax=Agromyces italicus TaxID=279572 RepID=UPI00040C27B2|nr:AMP-binding protein [Agromyces italicus]